MILYDSLNNPKVEVDKYDYYGTFMGESYLQLNIYSPTPINFEIGDYCTCRGENFYLNYIPSVEKKSGSGTRGDSFVYSNIKMNPASDELVSSIFFDVVPSTYDVTWSGLPSFSFYAQTAQVLADRIQYCLDSMYTGDKKWTVEVKSLADIYGNDIAVSGNKAIDATVSISNKTIMEALSEFYNTFKLTYIIRGRTITIGNSGIHVGSTFGYGIDKGLTGIEKNTKQDSKIITRLFCYGSSKNIGTKYYSNLTGHGVSGINKSGVSYETVRFTFTGEYSNAGGWEITLDGVTNNIDLTGIEKIGSSVAAKVATYSFNGWTVNYHNGNNYVEYTCNTAGHIAISSFYSTGITNTITVPSYGSNYYETVDNEFLFSLSFPTGNSYYKTKVSDNLYSVKFKYSTYEVNGFIDVSGSYIRGYIVNTETNYNNFRSAIITDDTGVLQITDGLYLDLLSYQYVDWDKNLPDNLSVTYLMLPDFPKVQSNPNLVYIDSPNISKYGIRQGEVHFDGSDAQHPEIYPSIKDMTASQVEAAGITLSLESGDNGYLDQVKACTNPTDNGTIPSTTDDNYSSWQKDFVLYIKDIGIDLTFMSGDKYYYATAGKMQISMTSGACSGRTFDITKIEKDNSLGYLRYKLTLNRVQDTSINKAYPYSEYQIASGDTFVILNIKMTDVYIKAAAQKLLSYGRAFLALNDETKFTYTPKLNEIWMYNNPTISNSIKEGDLFDFSDTDLDISGSVFIKTLHIQYGEKAIPIYELTLDDTIESSALQKTQNDIQSILNGTGLSEQAIESIVKNIGANNYLSKTSDDSAEGHITFNNGITVKDGVATDDLEVDNEALLKKGFKTDNFVSGVAGSGGKIDDKGNGELESLSVRSYLKVLELIYNRLSAMEGDFAFSEFGTIDSITEVVVGTYNVHFRKRHDNDFIAFHENDILMGVVDPKVNSTGTILYTSYLRVLSVNATDNTAQLLMYDGAETPSGTNHAPVVSMNMIRIGNTDSPTDGSVNSRQDFWKLSTDEGRIVFLQNVYKPILEAFNYALAIGKLPDLDMFKNLPIGKDDMCIFSKNIIAQNYFKIDANGIVQTNEVYRGLWSEQVASSEAPYRRIVKETTSGTGTVVNVLELHTVYHLGCKWACLVDKTTEEPKWNSTGWQMIQGDSNYSLDFSSTNGWQFFYGLVDTIISARIYYGNEDITERMLPLAGVSIEWIRNTDNIPEDNAWIPTYGANKLNLKLTTDDMGSNWMTKRTATFTCNIYIPVGEDTQLITNNISFNL